MTPTLALVLAPLLLAAAEPGPTVTVLHTSDLHGHVDPRDVLADRDLGEGLARVAAAVRRIRAEGPPTLLLDSGDTIEGSPVQASLSSPSLRVAQWTRSRSSSPTSKRRNFASVPST